MKFPFVVVSDKLTNNNITLPTKYHEFDLNKQIKSFFNVVLNTLMSLVYKNLDNQIISRLVCGIVSKSRQYH